MLNRYPFAAQISDSDTPVLPPVYSTTRLPGLRRPERSPASIIASAMRSFMLAVGFSLSSLISRRAQPLGTIRRNAMSEVPPMCERMDATGIFHFYVYTNNVYIDL